MRIVKRSTVNASVSNTTATQLFPYPMPGSLLAPAVSIFSQQSDTVMAGGALVGRRMLASLLGPAGLSDTYLLLDTDGQPVADTTHGSSGLGHGTSQWDPPHLSRVLQQQRADILNFQPLEAVVVAYREVVGVVSFISSEVVAPLNKVSSHRIAAAEGLQPPQYGIGGLGASKLSAGMWLQHAASQSAHAFTVLVVRSLHLPNLRVSVAG
jgi:hypothetical protein